MMKSPFPGMDPYLESHWGDVHARITVFASNQLRQQLPADLKVRVEEYIAVEDVDIPAQRQLYVPDVRILERDKAGSGATELAADVAVLEEPLIVPIRRELPTQREIRITDKRDGGRIVTAIEILSETNKTSARKDYERKRQELLEGGVNLVEIDLLRAGAWTIAAQPEVVRRDYRGPYRICVVRASDVGAAELYRASYSTRLPRIKIPLRTSDSDALLDIQALIDEAYETGGYDDIDYSQDPIPPFLPEELAWADKLLREQGRR